MKRVVGITAALAMLAGSPSYVKAELDESIVSYTFHFFSDVDGVDVMSQYAGGGMRWNSGVSFNVQYSHDVVVFRAIDAAPGSQEAVDAITTASRPITGGDAYDDFVKVRDEVTGIVAYRGAEVSYYVSNESDYFAQMVSLRYARDILGDNLNLAGGVSYGWDDIEPLAADNSATGVLYRKFWHGNLVATQIITPTTVFRIGGEYNLIEGLQHDPYRNVYVAGTNVPESHPNDRVRWNMFMRATQYITNRSSLRIDYRYYDDDWGIESHTIGGKLTQYVTDAVVMRYRYRYYTQLPAFFFLNSYEQVGGVTGFQTGDYRLGDYGSHLFGGQLIWSPHRAFGNLWVLKRAQVLMGYEHYFNSNNFSANVYEVGLRLTF